MDKIGECRFRFNVYGLQSYFQWNFLAQKIWHKILLTSDNIPMKEYKICCLYSTPSVAKVVLQSSSAQDHRSLFLKYSHSWRITHQGRSIWVFSPLTSSSSSYSKGKIQTDINNSDFDGYVEEHEWISCKAVWHSKICSFKFKKKNKET